MKIILISLAVICTVAFCYNQADQIYRRATLDEAVRFCMRWRIPDALVIDGNKYCRTDVEMYSPTGVVLSIPQIWSEKEMRTVFKRMEASPFCSNKIKENCIEP